MEWDILRECPCISERPWFVIPNSVEMGVGNGMGNFQSEHHAFRGRNPNLFPCLFLYVYSGVFSTFLSREVSYADEFLALPVEKVVDILQMNKLAVETEDAMFDAAIRWVRHDVNCRHNHLKMLITTCVHLPLLDERYVKV